MKTTIDIADELLIRAKDVARKEDRTLKELTEEGLRMVLSSRTRPSKPFKFKPHVVGGRGPKRDVTWAQMADALYGHEGEGWAR